MSAQLASAFKIKPTSVLADLGLWLDYGSYCPVLLHLTSTCQKSLTLTKSNVICAQTYRSEQRRDPPKSPKISIDLNDVNIHYVAVISPHLVFESNQKMNSCILFCVFKAFIVEVASSNVSMSVRVRDTHSVCTKSDWFQFSNWHMQCCILLIATQRQKLIHIRMVIQQPSWVNVATFFRSIKGMSIAMRPDIFFNVPTHLQPWHVTQFSLLSDQDS